MRGFYREVIETIALAIFLVLVIQSAVQNYRVEGPSMEPLLHSGDRVAVSKLQAIEVDAEHAAGILPLVEAEDGQLWHPFGQLTYGDVVVFRYPGDPSQNFVKRVIGMPGDRVRIERGTVFVNEVPLDEPYVHEEHEYPQTLNTHVVGAGSYYVLGDNREQSDDSRHWGDVPKENMVGKVMFTYWPLDRITMLSGYVPAL